MDFILFFLKKGCGNNVTRSVCVKYDIWGLKVCLCQSKKVVSSFHRIQISNLRLERFLLRFHFQGLKMKILRFARMSSR